MKDHCLMDTSQPSFFDEAERLDKLSKPGDPLVDFKNQIKSRIRGRMEHIYEHLANSIAGWWLEYIALARIKTAVRPRNLTYNITRHVQMIRLGQVAPAEGWKRASA